MLPHGHLTPLLPTPSLAECWHVQRCVLLPCHPKLSIVIETHYNHLHLSWLHSISFLPQSQPVVLPHGHLTPLLPTPSLAECWHVQRCVLLPCHPKLSLVIETHYNHLPILTCCHCVVASGPNILELL